VKQKVFSGIQPTGNLHLGNYLGAIKNWLTMQDDYLCIFAIMDLHAITVPQQPEILQQNILTTFATYIACGIDPSKTIIFQQSSVIEHAELCWLLSCNAPIGWLNRMTQFKEKTAKNKERAPLGLYAYPVLMASDILLYDVDFVPTGADQKQHIEFARDIALRFNEKYGQQVFTIPQPLIKGDATRVMNLRDGSKKMSKSDDSDYSRINITDEDEEIASKIMKAKTDDVSIKNLVDIYKTLAEDNVKEVNLESYKNFKVNLLELLIKEIAPIRVKRNQLLQDKQKLVDLLMKGQQNASILAKNKMSIIKNVIGLG